ncbi:uncharacterized protein [Typha angustifolia]|uniref:uncharacterized protein n=1 Tax=Typha angustifolia TaxID=59011 RepID=UPI003C2CC22A
MAKEEDLKRVDLKVTVNCCEGCKRKVMKAISIKGVLKTEIHPTLPKVTVVGNFDTKVLIKKLAKIGKNAEILPQKEEKKSDGGGGGGEKRPENAAGEMEKPKESHCDDHKATTKEKEKKTEADDTKNRSREDAKDEKRGNESKESRESSVSDATKLLYPPIVTALPQMSYAMSPSIVQGYGNPMATHHPMVFPPMPYYPINAYSAPLPYAYRDNYYCEPPPLQRPLQPPASSGFGDYFNDENTVGCHVM